MLRPALIVAFRELAESCCLTDISRMSAADELTRLIASGRLVFDTSAAETLERELLGTPPARAVHPNVQALLIGLCKKAPTTTLRISSLFRTGDSHHAEGRAVDIGNEEVASALLPVVATPAVVDSLSIDEIIFDASAIPGETSRNRYNFDAGRPHAYGDATLRKHRNHIHFAVRG